MALNCNWGNTPAYKMLKPIWDSIENPEGKPFRDIDEWKAQPDVVHMLDTLMCGSGMFGPPLSTVFSMVRLWAITNENAPEFYGRMRTWETLIGTTILSRMGQYDPDTQVYTEPPEGESFSLSPWIISRFVGYSCNWGESTRTEWVKYLRQQPEVKKYTAAYVNENINMYAKAYSDYVDLSVDPTQELIDAFVDA